MPRKQTKARKWNKSVRTLQYIRDNNRKSKFVALENFEDGLRKMISAGFTLDDCHEVIHIYQHGTINLYGS